MLGPIIPNFAINFNPAQARAAAQAASAAARGISNFMPGGASSYLSSVRPPPTPWLFGGGGGSALLSALPVLAAGAAAIGGTAGAADTLNRDLDQYSPTQLSSNPFKVLGSFLGLSGGGVEYKGDFKPDKPKTAPSAAPVSSHGGAPQDKPWPSHTPRGEKKKKDDTLSPPPYGVATVSDADRENALKNIQDMTSGQGRFLELPKPSITREAPGERPDFSSREAEIQRMMQSPQGFTAAFLDAFTRQFAPNIAAGRDKERDARVALASKELEDEQRAADEDFRRQEAIKDQIYLSQVGQGIGKVYGQDAKTGATGYFSPTELSTIYRQDEQMQLAQQNLERQLKALESQSEYHAALAQNLRAQAAKADRAEQLAVLSQYVDLLQTRLGTAMGGLDSNLQAQADIAQEALRQRLGLPASQAPAAPAAPVGPIEQRALQMGLPPELASGLDRLDTPSKRAAALEKLKKDPKNSQYVNILGQLLGGGQ